MGHFTSPPRPLLFIHPSPSTAPHPLPRHTPSAHSHSHCSLTPHHLYRSRSPTGPAGPVPGITNTSRPPVPPVAGHSPGSCSWFTPPTPLITRRAPQRSQCTRRKGSVDVRHVVLSAGERRQPAYLKTVFIVPWTASVCDRLTACELLTSSHRAARRRHHVSRENDAVQ